MPYTVDQANSIYGEALTALMWVRVMLHFCCFRGCYTPIEFMFTNAYIVKRSQQCKIMPLSHARRKLTHLVARSIPHAI